MIAGGPGADGASPAAGVQAGAGDVGTGLPGLAEADAVVDGTLLPAAGGEAVTGSVDAAAGVLVRLVGAATAEESPACGTAGVEAQAAAASTSEMVSRVPRWVTPPGTPVHRQGFASVAWSRLLHESCRPRQQLGGQ